MNNWSVNYRVNSNASHVEERFSRGFELTAKTGLSVHTIRFYEKEGILDSRHVQREENRYRRYSDDAVERLNFVKTFQGIGCSLAELKEILQDHVANSRTDLEILELIRPCV
ncbi:MerR family transcriptional regulator [Alicyclobacillus sp. ALC3]|uniref:MerR family transcriptional regulator n=1 Tax=Alicyclobacillus sp. ALC3 TaxID=2796143 RepID=UPI0023794EDA|nr:MerR family transcriptional regulator [Alicyclobacillus sp. ALC3]WDL98560.1 MerR family transcriptional regulator [Alicyclobacillus sp. ALC3]